MPASTLDEERTLARRIAGKVRQGFEDDANRLRGELALLRIERRIAEAVEAAPPLPEAVVDRITRIIRAAADRPSRTEAA